MSDKSELSNLLKIHTAEEICDSLSISRRTLSRRLKRFGLVRVNYGPKKLSEEIISRIRQLYGADKMTQKELAKKFHVSQSLICKIVNNEVHKNVGLIFCGNAEIKVGYRHGN